MAVLPSSVHSAVPVHANMLCPHRFLLDNLSYRFDSAVCIALLFVFQPCLQRSFKAEVYSCPACRTDLGKDMDMEQNKVLGKALNGLFPGYENGR